MTEPDKNRERSLDAFAKDAVREIVEEFHGQLMSTAELISVGEHVTEKDVRAAFKRLALFSDESIQFADAQAVISQALKENRAVEWVSYAMALVLFVFGLILLTVGAVISDVAARLGYLVSGSIVELLILLPFRFAVNSLRHNIALRMLGMVINRVDDPEKLAPLLKDTFVAVVLGRPESKVANGQ